MEPIARAVSECTPLPIQLSTLISPYCVGTLGKCVQTTMVKTPSGPVSYYRNSALKVFIGDNITVAEILHNQVWVNNFDFSGKQIAPVLKLVPDVDECLSAVVTKDIIICLVKKVIDWGPSCSIVAYDFNGIELYRLDIGSEPTEILSYNECLYVLDGRSVTCCGDTLFAIPQPRGKLYHTSGFAIANGECFVGTRPRDLTAKIFVFDMETKALTRKIPVPQVPRGGADLQLAISAGELFISSAVGIYVYDAVTGRYLRRIDVCGGGFAVKKDTLYSAQWTNHGDHMYSSASIMLKVWK